MRIRTIRRALAVSTAIAMCAVLAPSAAYGDATGWQGYEQGQISHTIKGAGRTATYQAAKASNQTKACSARIDFTERDRNSALVKRSTGTTIQGCVYIVSRERYNITFASNTTRACATFVGSVYEGRYPVTGVQCHGISG